MDRRKKHFDAVEMSRKLRVATGRRLFGMTQKERLAYLNRRLNSWKVDHQQKEESETVSAR